MAELWVKTVSFLSVLFLIGGIFIYFLITGLNTEDSTKIDPIPKKRHKKE